MSLERSAPGYIRSEGTGKHDVNHQSDKHFWADIDQQIEVPLHQQLAVKHVAEGPVQSQRVWEIFNRLKTSVVTPVGGGPAQVRDEEDHG